MALLGSAIAVGLALSAAGPPTLAAAPARSCFWIRGIENFTAPDDQTVYVRVAGRNIYELKLFAPCPDVTWSHRLALRSRSSSFVCEGSATTLEIYTRSVAGRQRCPVASVRKLTPAEVAALPKRALP
jgi:hypothetical protein